MANKKTPLSRFLIPIDGSEHSNRAVKFGACLAAGLRGRVQSITLLHVIAGRYLSQHMANVDVRAGHIMQTELMQRLKAQYLAASVEPILKEAEELLRKTGVETPVDHKIADGDPADQILKISEEGNYSTIIMARRGLSQVKELLLGSVTSAILHRPRHPTTYVVGQRIMDHEACLLPRILIPLDGSPHSLAAVHEAAVIAGCYGESLENVILLHVVDIAHYAELAGHGEHPEKDANLILDEGKSILLKAGVKPEKLKAMAIYGRPVEQIVRVAQEKDMTLIMMGRQGRTAVSELLMGKVSSAVIHRCADPTVAIVCEGSC